MKGERPLTPKGSPGCMMVFESIDDMKEAFPGVDESKIMTFWCPDE